MKSIRSVDQIRNKIILANNNKKITNINFNLEKKLEDRLKFRELNWSETDRQNYDKFLIRLNIAHKKLTQNLVEYIVNKSERVLNKNINALSFKIWLGSDKEFDKCNTSEFQINSLLYGFWNQYNNKICRLRHLEAGINCIPIVHINGELNHHGYKIVDITDTRKSFNKVWEVYFVK